MPSQSPSYILFLTCPRGLEPFLSAELDTLGLPVTQSIDGGVYTRGGLADIYRTNLHVRTAGRVLIQVADGAYRNESDIYRLACQTDWSAWFGLDRLFRVQADSRKSPLKNTAFAALKIKDAVCDNFRSRTGQRPSIDKTDPDVRIHAFFDSRRAKIFIDTSGEALFKRGYRQESGEAPLRENLAAGLLLAAGYDGSRPFQDPFCGSGTIAIEAALIAARIPPGRHRRFGFERLAIHRPTLWQTILQEADAALRSPPASIQASDHDPELIRSAIRNAQSAGVSEWIRFQTADVCTTRPESTNGLMLSNPPYGERLSEQRLLHSLYPQWGSWLKQYYAGWLAGWFTGDRNLPTLMRLNPKRKIPLYNGKLDCRLFLFDMVAGSNRKR